MLYLNNSADIKSKQTFKLFKNTLSGVYSYQHH